MAASRALIALLAAAAAAADTCPNLWTLANVATGKTIQDIGARRRRLEYSRNRARAGSLV